MPLNPKDPYVAIGLASVICAVPALLTTAYRLYIRQSRYWADDLFALLSGLSLLLMVASTFVHITFTPGTSPAKKETMIAAYYLMSGSFYCVLWFARLSMLFSVIRIHPEYGFGFGFNFSTRKVLYFISVIFATILITLLCQLFWVCEPGNATSKWKEKERPQCVLTKQVVILQVVSDFLSDLIIVLVPIRLIQTLSSHSLRRRMAWIFSTAIITTAVSIPHATFIIIGRAADEVIAAYVEVCIGLIVCNIPVVITRLIKHWGKHSEYTMSIRGSKWTSIKFERPETRRTEDTQSSTGVANSHAVKTTTIGEITGARWFRWDPDLSEEDSTPSRSRATCPVTIELGQGVPDQQEDDTRPEYRYPPRSFTTKSTVTWS